MLLIFLEVGKNKKSFNNSKLQKTVRTIDETISVVLNSSLYKPDRFLQRSNERSKINLSGFFLVLCITMLKLIMESKALALGKQVKAEALNSSIFNAINLS